ncbi:M1 family metallopeptidase [Flavobacterium sp. RHBU_24]|uniref:M1 family metallopeptidase n=1 Tax=Flavobacterium sp. RHBU_24 TaxID=3391185 RepID=UPI0039854DC4
MKTIFYTLSLFATLVCGAQQYKLVDFKTLDARISFNIPEKSVHGFVSYTFEVLGKKTDTIYIDAQNMQFEDVKVNGRKKTGWIASTKALKLFKGYKKGKNTVTFNYTAHPKQTLYFVGDVSASTTGWVTKATAGGDTIPHFRQSFTNGDVQLWTQGQGKYTSHWLPSFDDVNEKVIFNLTVGDANTNYEVLANGKMSGMFTEHSERFWEYKMDKTMSSYLVMLAMGNFKKWEEKATSGTLMEYYLRTEDSLKYAPTYRDSKRIFDFFEREIGVPYAWGIYRQVPVLDFLYAGMENTSSTIFSQDFVVDETGFNDRTYINVNAHELAHQWFGDLVTAESGTHHWLQEGFATYYALLAEQELYGEDHFNYELYQLAERLEQASKTDTIPVMNEKASTLSFYQKGAWALHILREGVGHEAFRTAVKNYLTKYAFKNVNTNQFLSEVKAVAPGYDTETFKRRWLESGTFEVEEALALLGKNKFMQAYFSLGELQGKPFAEAKETYLAIMKSDVFYPVKEEVLFQIAKVPFEEKAEIIRLAMASGKLKLRQAVARTIANVPAAFAEEYKTLLFDDSYITKEIALNVLYKRFPERQAELLDISKNWIGFNDKNLRILWLTLAYASKTYNPDNKDDYYAELIHYAGSSYESSIRQNALQNLLYIGKADPLVWQNLVNATLHHKWQFVKFGKDNLRKLLKKPGYRELITSILPNISEAEKVKLQQLLDEK